MADSNATITRLSLIKRAFRRIGKFTPTNTDLANAVDLLNDKVKELDAQGEWFWAVSNTPTSLSILTSTQTYAVGTPPTGISNYLIGLARFELVQGTSLTPLTILDKADSLSTILREGVGTPAAVFLERATVSANNKLWLYPSPSGNYTAQYYGRRRLYDFDAATDNPDLPQEMNQPLVKLLASELAPEYGLSLDEQQLHQAHADRAILQIQGRDSDRVTAVPLRTVYY